MADLDTDLKSIEKMAMEFDTENSLKKYLKDHPKADRARHTVKTPGKAAPGGAPEGKEPAKAKGEGGTPPKTKGGQVPIRSKKYQVWLDGITEKEFEKYLDDPIGKEMQDKYKLKILAGRERVISKEDLERAREVRKKMGDFEALKSADLCKDVSPPVCVDNLGIERDSMPQFTNKPIKVLRKALSDDRYKEIQDDIAKRGKGPALKDLSDEERDNYFDKNNAESAVAAGANPSSNKSTFDLFLDHLKKKGVKVKDMTKKGMRAGDMRATQSEIRAQQVIKNADKFLSGKMDPKDVIYVSSDGHILDGHHRWAGVMTANPEARIPAIQIGLPMKELLSEAFDLNGVFRQDFNFDVVEPSKPVDLARKDGETWQQRGKWYAKAGGKAAGPFKDKAAAKAHAEGGSKKNSSTEERIMNYKVAGAHEDYRTIIRKGPEMKDRDRIRDMAQKARNNTHLVQLAQQMANSITGYAKALRRGLAAQSDNYPDVAAIFFDRAEDLQAMGKVAGYQGNPGGADIYPNDIGHGYGEPLAGATDVMRRLQNTLLHEQGNDEWIRPESPRLASVDETLKEIEDATSEDDITAEIERLARFTEGKPADPTKNMSPEDAAKWKDMNEEHGDKFKTAADETLEELEKEASMADAWAPVQRAMVKLKKLKPAVAREIEEDMTDDNNPHHDRPGWFLDVIEKALGFSVLGAQELLPAGIRSKIPKLYSQENVKDPTVWVKFFSPYSNWTWLATEFDGRDQFFGLVKGFETELGYFSLRELQSVKGPGGIPGVERDIHFTPKPLSRAKSENRMAASDGDPYHEDRLSGFEKGVSADPTENMSPEDKKTWDEMNEKHQDKFKNKTASRPIREIAREIRMDWGPKVNYAAKPYLDAMMSLNSIDDYYDEDPASMVVAYFLSNATSWKGEVAKRVKLELNAMLKAYNKHGSDESLSLQPDYGTGDPALPRGAESIAPGYEQRRGLRMAARPIYDIASEIYDDWESVSPYAKPYLSAMSSLKSINDHYGADSGASVVAYFLSNASSWKGEKAKAIKLELKAMLKGARFARDFMADFENGEVTDTGYEALDKFARLLDADWDGEGRKPDGYEEGKVVPGNPSLGKDMKPLATPRGEAKTANFSKRAGYTHYWKQSREFTDEEWAKITAFAKQAISKAAKLRAIPGTEASKTPAFVAYVAEFGIVCRGGSGVGLPVVSNKAISLNGDANAKDENLQDLDLAHETFYLSKKPTAFAFCKTARKPYDVVVASILVVAKKTAPDAIDISSNGTLKKVLAAEDEDPKSGLHGDQKEGKFTKNEPADPTENMSEEDKALWLKYHGKVEEVAKTADSNALKMNMTEEPPPESASAVPGDADPEREAMFEKGVKADPTENMNPEEKAKWEKYHGKVEELAKTATVSLDKIPSGKHNTFKSESVYAHVWFDADVARSDAGNRVPTSGEWQVIISTSPDHLNQNPRGRVLAQEKFRFADPKFRGAVSADAENFIWRNFAIAKRKVFWEAQDLKEMQGLLKSNGYDPDGAVKLQEADINPLELRDLLRKGHLEGFHGIRKTAAGPSGLYGFTRSIQSDCDGACKRLSKTSDTLARSSYTRDNKVADFLVAHARRADSIPANLLVASMRGMMPKIASADPKVARLEELRTKMAEFALTDADKKVIRAFIDQKVASSKALSSDGKTLNGLWMGGNKIAEWLGGSRIKLNDTGAKSGDVIARFIKKEAPANLLKQAVEASMDVDAAKHGLYGFAGRTAKIGLQACTELRHEAGRIANELHARRKDAHDKITGFLSKHADEGGCMYSRLIAASYPDASVKMASLNPTTVAAWIDLEV